jgi:protein-tyrosine-phosphatase
MLFVCYGNICRSPFAAGFADRRLRQAGVDGIRCSSAGFRANQRAFSPPEAIEAAERYGVDLSGNRPIVLSHDLVRTHDVVFVMEPAHLAELRRRWPGERARYFLLARFDSPPSDIGAYEREHLVDPFGQGPEAFAESYARIARAVEAVVARITG